MVHNLEEPPLLERVRHRFDDLPPPLRVCLINSVQVYDRNVSLRLRADISGLGRRWLVVHKDAGQFGNASINEPLHTHLGLIEGLKLSLAIIICTWCHFPIRWYSNLIASVCIDR
uniref:Uncharacterized protein n=1 Tax=Opuntia streptacantha TaxID=393608 RepID=A0A7C9A592_OPUST